jgi:hypothetical protein
LKKERKQKEGERRMSRQVATNKKKYCILSRSLDMKERKKNGKKNLEEIEELEEGAECKVASSGFQ